LYNIDFTGNKFLGTAKPGLFMLTGRKRKYEKMADFRQEDAGNFAGISGNTLY